MAHDTAPAPVIDESGHFHATDDPIDLSGYLFEDWLALGFFTLLALDVFYQFVTRYVVNDSAAWTEEIARYLLIATVFVAIPATVRRTRHVHVDFLYRLIPAGAGRVLSTLVDAIRIAFFVAAVLLTVEMMQRMSHYKMTIVDLPMNLVYGVCLFGFACATWRSLQVARENWKRGYSSLERPDHAVEETIE